MAMAKMSETNTNHIVTAVRQFNRFYTKLIGVLNEGLLESKFSLTEVRVLYEVAYRDQPSATEIGSALGLDAGYLSRLLRSFERSGLIQRTRSEEDGRQNVIALTALGRKTFDLLDIRSNQDVATTLNKLSTVDQARLVEAMHSIERLLEGDSESQAPYILRPPQPGDMGWIVHRHGLLYSKEYGWDERFEGLVAEIVASFIQNFDPVFERCWIAEIEGEIVGSIFLVQKSKKVAKLRLLLVEPKARGLGIGKRLVDECVRFARQARYQKIVLWTQSNLFAARKIYKDAGFQLISEEPHNSFGHALISETWELDL
jgi:DNA-binding MarR family transcriptional regulator/N-acetylglutamate synthase-like GNAT family acetyltransferase